MVRSVGRASTNSSPPPRHPQRTTPKAPRRPRPRVRAKVSRSRWAVRSASRRGFELLGGPPRRSGVAWRQGEAPTGPSGSVPQSPAKWRVRGISYRVSSAVNPTGPHGGQRHSRGGGASPPPQGEIGSTFTLGHPSKAIAMAMYVALRQLLLRVQDAEEKVLLAARRGRPRRPTQPQGGPVGQQGGSTHSRFLGKQGVMCYAPRGPPCFLDTPSQVKPGETASPLGERGPTSAGGRQQGVPWGGRPQQHKRTAPKGGPLWKDGRRGVLGTHLVLPGNCLRTSQRVQRFGDRSP